MDERWRGRMAYGRAKTALVAVAAAGLALALTFGTVALTAVPASAGSTGWSVTPTSNIGPDENDMRGVWCESATSCIAVGDYFSNDNGTFSYRTLIESWDGTSWYVTPSPSPGSSYNELDAISCVNASSCVAVGRYDSDGNGGTLIETWDGSSWSASPGPNVGNGVNYLYGVSCTSTTRCVAVGNSDNGTSQQTLIDSWDGTSWSVIPSPSPATTINTLSAVSCASASSCVAVGAFADAGASNQALALLWDGTSWTATPTPSVEQGTDLQGVSCVSTTVCTAVGFVDSSSGTEPLIESWDGTTWSQTPSADVGSSGGSLYGVSCVSDASCAAVGYTGSTPDRTLVQTWDGTNWSVTASPSPGTRYNALFGVSCVDVQMCAAVGFYRNYDTASQSSRHGAQASQLNRTLAEVGAAVSPPLPIATVTPRRNATPGEVVFTWKRWAQPKPRHGMKFYECTSDWVTIGKSACDPHNYSYYSANPRSGAISVGIVAGPIGSGSCGTSRADRRCEIVAFPLDSRRRPIVSEGLAAPFSFAVPS